MAVENRILTEELQARKDRLKQLWQTNCKQLQEFGQSLLTKKRRAPNSKAIIATSICKFIQEKVDPHAVSLTSEKSITQPLYSTARVGEPPLSGVSELFDVPSVALTYSEPQTSLSSHGSTLTRLPPISQLERQPIMAESGVTEVSFLLA